MTVDRLTGIKLAGSTFREGQTYTSIPGVSSLLNSLNLGVNASINNFSATLDVTRSKLQILVSADVSAAGLELPLDFKIVFSGKSDRNQGIAKDFSVNRIGAGGHIGGLLESEVVANAKTKRFSLATSFKAIDKNPSSLLKPIKQSTAKVFVGGAVASQVQGLLEDASISLVDRTTAAGPFIGNFDAGWWTTPL